MFTAKHSYHISIDSFNLLLCSRNTFFFASNRNFIFLHGSRRNINSSPSFCHHGIKILVMRTMYKGMIYFWHRYSFKRFPRLQHQNPSKCYFSLQKSQSKYDIEIHLFIRNYSNFVFSLFYTLFRSRDRYYV